MNRQPTAHKVRIRAIGDAFLLLPPLEGHGYVLITRDSTGTYVYASDPRGIPLKEDDNLVLLYHTDQSPQDALIDLGYTEGSKTLPKEG